MEFKTLKVENHFGEMDSALTIGQIKELLQYVAKIKDDVRKFYLTSMKNYDEGSQEYVDCLYKAEMFRFEEQALNHMSVCIDEYIS